MSARRPNGGGEPQTTIADESLSMRILDHYSMAGEAIIAPESASVASVRRSVMELGDVIDPFPPGTGDPPDHDWENPRGDLDLNRCRRQSPRQRWMQWGG